MVFAPIHALSSSRCRGSVDRIFELSYDAKERDEPRHHAHTSMTRSFLCPFAASYDVFVVVVDIMPLKPPAITADKREVPAGSSPRVCRALRYKGFGRAHEAPRTPRLLVPLRTCGC